VLQYLSSSSGAQIRLGDIAHITDRFELNEDKILFNGQRAAILKISKTKMEDNLIIGDAVKAFVDKRQQTAPPGVHFSLTDDRFSIVRDRLNLLLKNGIQGLILVAMTLWLFFSFRFAFWVVMGLPISFLGTIFFMTVLGQSLNMLTMVGLLIAIGLRLKQGNSSAASCQTGVQSAALYLTKLRFELRKPVVPTNQCRY